MPISLTTTAYVTGVPNRRILHQPFFPLVSSPPPPSPPPLPPPPPQNLPFFPSYPSPPSPPPPSPASSASFPANISSLVIPQNPNSSKTPSQKLIAGTISAVVATIIVLSLLSIYYLHRRRRRLSSSDEVKTQRSDHSSSRRTSNYNFRLRTRSFNFLYLGNIVNSQHNVNEEINSNNDGDNHNNARALNSHIGSDPKKFDSPELRPLPPLIHQSSRRNFNAGSTTDDEFYSPKGSIGSGSMRTVAAEDGGDFGGQSGDTSSYSSSTSSSPARSHSGSTSPPVSLSPIRPKSTPPQDPPAVEVPGHVEWKYLSSELGSSPSRNEDQDKNSLSSASMSPERNLEMSNEALVLRRSNDSDEFKSSQSVSSSPERKQEVCMPRMSNELELLKYSRSLSHSPGRNVEMTDEIEASLRRESCDLDLTQSPSSSTSPRKSSHSDQAMCLGSVSLLSPLPERDVEMTHEASLHRRSSDLEKTREASPARKLSDFDQAMRSQSHSSLSSLSSYGNSPDRVSGNHCLHDQNERSSRVSSASTSPERSFQKSSRASSPIVMPNNVGLNERINSVLERSVSAAPLPPPPPPPPPPPSLLVPLMRQQRRWSLPVAASTTNQPIIKPPELTPPSRPFAWQSTSDVSSIKLPPSSDTRNSVEETPKPKLKPLHWDKVRASSDREMVWDQLRSSSFKLNEEIFDTLFVVNTHTPKPKQTTPRPVVSAPNQENRVLDHKKAQNIAISLRALNVTIDEVCEALLEGNVDMLGTELLESLLKMAPTKEEERKLKEFKDDSLYKLVQAERFLKAILDVPFAFQRVEAMLYIANFDTEVEYLKSSFETLEGACEELRSSRMFLKLLEAVLKTGNRMNVGTNRGDAHAFKLDTLLKLVDVKGADGKTTLLHFVVQEVIRTEGARISVTSQTPDSASSEDARCRKLGLQVVSGLSSELTNVKKAAAMDSDALSSDVSKLSRGIENIGEVLQLIKSVQTGESNEKFPESMSKFVTRAEEEIFRLQAHESVAMTLVKEITEYFHGDSAKEEAHPFRIFMVVRDFLTVLDRVCKEVGTINDRTMVSSAHKFPVPVNPTIPQAALFASTLRRPSSFDDESESP